MNTKKLSADEVWTLYKKGVDHHNAVDMYERTEKCHDFYIGEQWRGLKSGNETFPIINFIKPIGKYKISTIAQNIMSVVLSPIGTYGDENNNMASVADILSQHINTAWERTQMDKYSWDIVKNAFITGDHYAYSFYDKEIKIRLINKTNIYMSDEQNCDINAQEWIIISERLSVDYVKQEAERNGISKSDVALIASDTNTETQIGQDSGKEVKTESGKTNAILFMRKTKAGIEFCRAVEGVIYQPMEVVDGLDVYPLAGMRWEDRIGDSRGVSGVEMIIPTQIEVNRVAARRSIAIKRFAFPKMVVDESRISNVEDIEKAGAVVKVNGMASNPIRNFLDYINPAPISVDAANFQSELINVTRDMEGAGDTALGNISPEKASGEAIKAARDQAAIPLNEQISSYKQFVEDLARVWYKLMIAYNPSSMTVESSGGFVTIDTEQIKQIEMNIKIDVSPTDPYSLVSQDIALERLMSQEHITFDEYIKALNPTSSVPKVKLEQMILERGGMSPELLKIIQSDPQLAQAVEGFVMQMIGGENNAMPQMPYSDVDNGQQTGLGLEQNPTAGVLPNDIQMFEQQV